MNCKKRYPELFSSLKDDISTVLEVLDSEPTSELASLSECETLLSHLAILIQAAQVQLAKKRAIGQYVYVLEYHGFVKKTSGVWEYKNPLISITVERTNVIDWDCEVQLRSTVGRTQDTRWLKQMDTCTREASDTIDIVTEKLESLGLRLNFKDRHDFID